MNKGVLHVVAWLAYFLIELLRYIFFSDFNDQLLIISRLVITIGIKASLFYLVFSLCVPRYAFYKKWGLFASSLILSLTIFLLLNTLSYYFFQIWLNQGAFDYAYLIYFGLDAFVIIAIAILAAYASRHQAHEKQLLSLKKERTQEKLRMLQAQINPHFLFNTLNNIYSLALHNSDKTASAIQQLSAVMRYVFEQSDAIRVSLKAEIETVNNLLAIGTLASEEGFTLKKEIQYDQNFEIIPLCIVPLIENFIKYGDLSKNGFLNLCILTQHDDLKVKMKNAIAQKVRHNTHRTGLENLRKRLELTYGDNFDLSFSKSESKQVFNLELSIKL